MIRETVNFVGSAAEGVIVRTFTGAKNEVVDTSNYASDLGTGFCCGAFKFASCANKVLETGRDTFYRRSDVVVRNVVFEVTKRTLKALGQDLGGVVVILEGIFTNKVNANTLAFILDNRLGIDKRNKTAYCMNQATVS
ncbi:hypothetical protein V1506DRAFT_390082 [Lipomyces tetrasporus]